jgi:hypothetical protein
MDEAGGRFCCFGLGEPGGGDRSVGSRDDKWGGIGMLVTEYAKGNELDFRMESLKVYGVLVGLLGEEREMREDGYVLVSYRELGEDEVLGG